MKTFWRKYNGSQAFLIWLPILFGSSYLVRSNMDIPYPVVELALNLIYGICKIFLAELVGSVLLQVNQPQYFDVVHESEHITKDQLTPSWRESAFKYYALYCLGAFLVLGFA